MWKISRLLFFLWWSFSAFGQSPNDWIDYSQRYFKFKVKDKGLYRITAGELSAAGVPIGNISVTRYQLYRRGEELAISTFDTDSDGRLDYLEFFAKGNDGTSDTELYETPEAQPHTFYNLFSDSAAYFLTWQLSGGTGKRMDFSTIKDASGLEPEENHLATSINLQTNRYSRGKKFGPGFDLQSAKYTFAEGWTGSDIVKNTSRNFTIQLTNEDRSAAKPFLSLLLTGVTNFDHLADILVGPTTTNLRQIGQASWTKATNFYFADSLEWSDVNNDGTLIVQISVVGVGSQTDRMALSYAKCDYDADFALDESDYHKFLVKASGASRGYISIPTTEAAQQSVYDITNFDAPVRLANTAFSDRLEFVFQDQTVDRQLAVVSAFQSIDQIKEVVMSPIELTNEDYMIISHPEMNSPVDGSNPVDEYISYRSSEAGGNFDVLYADVSDVFNQFNYGDPSPLAIKNYIKNALSNGSPKYLFLIGKGTTADFNYYRQDPATTNLIHFVPTFGVPGGDLLYSVGVEGNNNVPAVPVGRLNARTSADVKAYLEKVKEMESQPYNVLWRKDLIQLSGGQTQNELNNFSNFIKNFKSIAEGDFLGGNAQNINKNSTNAVEIINIADAVNDGVGLITFFGHSSGTVTDIEIGRVSDIAAGYSNQGKYPVILVNGCNAGEIFGNNFTFGEDWINTPNKGAVAFVANSDFALSSSLKRYSDLFYQLGFATDELFGMSVGDLVVHISENYFLIYGTDDVSESQVYQTLVQGDPYIKVFGADAPDYEVQSAEIFADAFDQDRVLANADSFRIRIPIRNFGRTVLDSLEIQIERTLSDGSVESLGEQFERILRFDTVDFVIKNDPGTPVEGDNSFTIHLNPDRNFEELNFANNQATFDLFIPKGNTINLFPIDHGVVTEDTATLKWQSSNLIEESRLYALEVDTSDQFNSPALMSESVEGKLLMEAIYSMVGFPDSTSIFWRTRFAQPIANEDTSWVTSSFAYLPSSSQVWSQVDDDQIKENANTGIIYNPATSRFEFKETSQPIQINTHGVGHPNAYEDYQVIVNGLNLLLTDNAADPVCKKLNAINAVVFDKQSAQPYRPLGISGADINNDLVCGRLPQMIHNFNESEVLGSNRWLDSLITVMDKGDMIVLFSFDSIAYSNWDDQLKTSLNNVGIQTSTINSLVDGQPVIFLGRKGDPVGSAIEITSNGSGLPPKDQAIELISEVTGKFIGGQLRSPRIGPAKFWKDFSFFIESENEDIVQVEVIGVTESGVRQSILSNSRSTDLDLSMVDATIYPFIELNFLFFDQTNLTPPQLNAWGVGYDLPPEGLIRYEEDAISLQEGAPFNITFQYQHLGGAVYSDSLNVDFSVSNSSSGMTRSQSVQFLAPDSLEQVTVELSESTNELVGANNVQITVSGEREIYTINNELRLSNQLEVTADQVNPVLDVTFDGNYILDGDIISPNPTILIKLKDENQFLFKEDTVGINISLKAPCEGCDFERIHFTNPEVTYMPATDEQDLEIRYNPSELADGVYELRVQATDASGNSSGLEPYEISFEVINESTITHFYPYPNPFSSQTRFVFTLTGSEIPDEIKIQIMTVSGRIVREITQDEIGPLKIGNNMTSYAWDGRDEFGDQLANGVYLYRVIIRNQGQGIDHRSTSADRAFKNGFGKIYLLR